MSESVPAGLAAATRLAQLGRSHDRAARRVVNPPVVHASTVLFASLADLEDDWANPRAGLHYGRQGTETTFALEAAIADLDGAAGAVALPSGLAAIAVALLAHLKAGDHLLVADNGYAPTRRLAERHLARFGVTTSYYPPGIGAGIAALIRPETRAIYLEAPGSLTFEMADVPAIAAAAKARGVATVMDNTWATPLNFKPLAHGVDVALMAATKYVVGHSDAMMGVVCGTAESLPRLRDTAQLLGYHAAPDDCYLALRGLRTMGLRLARHQESGLMLARWLAARPEVARVLHPALPGDPGHALWRRDFAGASGLFAFVLRPPVTRAQLGALLDGMRLFGMGYSWGGYESLLLPVNPAVVRTAEPWTEPGPLLRIHVGLEDPADLVADLDAGFARMAAAA